MSALATAPPPRLKRPKPVVLPAATKGSEIPVPLLTTLLDETHQGILVVDSTCRVTYCNFAMSLLFPHRAVRVGANLAAHPALAETLALLQNAMTEQRRMTGEVRISFPMGTNSAEERIYRATASPLDPTQGDGAWFMADDVTEQAITEQIRKDFVTNASHELRTPLSLIGGYIETLQSGMIKGGASMLRCLDVMEKHSKRMMRVIEDMLTISRLESDDALLKMETFHVRSCVEDVLEHLTPLIEVRQPKITLDFPESGGLLHGDRYYWDQVFTNLIENALKENAQPGLKLHITGEWQGAECTLSVTDDGVGIPAEDVPFVFKRFFRCAKHHSQETKGTGLGLSIVKRAVEAHHGTIELYSCPGVATTFTIRVPDMRS